MLYARAEERKERRMKTIRMMQEKKRSVDNGRSPLFEG
jgi:hypothetical protein